MFTPDLDIIFSVSKTVSILLIPLGVVLLLYGYKLFRIFLALIGFAIGFVAGITHGVVTADAIQ